jgi:hypothetical protein
MGQWSSGIVGDIALIRERRDIVAPNCARFL